MTAHLQNRYSSPREIFFLFKSIQINIFCCSYDKCWESTLLAHPSALASIATVCDQLSKRISHGGPVRQRCVVQAARRTSTAAPAGTHTCLGEEGGVRGILSAGAEACCTVGPPMMDLDQLFAQVDRVNSYRLIV